MAQYKVIEKFRDKETKKINKAGTVIELTDARAKEILKVGDFIEAVEEDSGADEAAEETTTTTKKKTTKKKTTKKTADAEE